MTLALAPPSRLWADAPLLTGLTLAIALATLPLALAAGLDPRQFQGEGIWVKPLKFHAALAVYAGTLALYARWLPPGLAHSRWWRVYLGVVAAAIMAELLWVGGAAAMGTASHFNLSSPVWTALYALMGLSAVILTSLSLAFGLAVARNPATGLDPALNLSLVVGLVLTFVLTVIVAGVMSAGQSHHVGLPVTGARVPLMGWSREVGDLRVAHFLATHALHAVPLAGLLSARLWPGARGPVIGAGLAYAGLVLAAFAQALAGRPLI
jgi:hypothetical protein